MGKKVLRALGIWGYIAFGVFALLFVLGETLDDPGTSNGVALIAMWMVPLAVLMVLVQLRVSYLRTVMLALSGLALVASVVIAVLPRGWLDFKFTNGPVIGIATLALTFAMAWWAHYEQRLAGMLIVLVSGVPLVAEMIAQGFVHWGGSTVALQFPGVLAGAMIWFSSSKS
jgi:hypothetical protein